MVVASFSITRRLGDVVGCRRTVEVEKKYARHSGLEGIEESWDTGVYVVMVMIIAMVEM